jgi:hypothetical protein
MTNNNLYIDLNTNTINVTKAFYQRASIYGTPEFKKLRNCIAEMKAETGEIFKVEVKTRTIKNRSEDQEKRKNLLNRYMVEYIRTRDDREALLKEFETIRIRSRVQPNPRRFVQDWFIASFPGYEDVLEKIVAKEKAELKSLNTEKEAV